ncbi:unnamed protein product [Paramecium octaurelia]|uniref:Uncharacterized protein n=1 Tax=Paramecium octaurelia TaxID=43137 RepID=A0A8S1URW8_PAROT|nr:unnamed protein product [Paramecium octaurelia]
MGIGSIQLITLDIIMENLQQHQTVNIIMAQKSEGCYDKGMKIGQWIEICDEFRKCQQITLNGEYNNGKKVGVWMEMQRDKDKTEEGFKTVKEIQYDK